MNMKKSLALLLSGLLLVGTLAGCAAKSMDMAYNGAMAPEADYKEEVILSDGIYDMADTETAEKTESAPVTQRKLIRKIYLDAETEDLDALLSAVDSKVAALGGYMERREIYSGSAYSSYKSSRRADLTIRIPKDRLDEFVAHVASTGNVISSNETSDDVTLSYVATQSRMTALQKEEARLLALIDQAANLTELLELEKRLTEVRTELESVTSQLLVYDNLVDFGTVTLSVREVQTLTPVEEPGFWQRISTGFMESLQNLWNFLKELAIALIVALPYLVPLALVVLIAVLLIRRAIRRKKMSKWKPPFPNENAPK